MVNFEIRNYNNRHQTPELLQKKADIEKRSKKLIELGTPTLRNLGGILDEDFHDKEINGVDAREVRSNLGRLLIAIDSWDVDHDKSVEAEELENLIEEVASWIKSKSDKDSEEHITTKAA